MRLLAILIFISLPSTTVSQTIFYADLKPSESDLLELVKFAEEYERNGSYFHYDEYGYGLVKSEYEYIKQAKSQKPLNPSENLRIYVWLPDSFDTLYILGYSLIYNIEELKSSIYFIHSLESFQNHLTTKDFESLLDILNRNIIQFITVDKAIECVNTTYEFKENYNILDPCFYLFTCPEVYLYERPFDSNPRADWEAHNFISNKKSVEIDYYNFPTPSNVRFALITKQIVSKSASEQIPDWIKLESNVALVLEQKFVGLTFINKSETKIFWAEKSYIDEYLKDFPTFFVAMDLFYKMSIRELFLPLH